MSLIKIVGNILSGEKKHSKCKITLCCFMLCQLLFTHYTEKTFKTKCNKFMQLLYEFLIEILEFMQETRDVVNKEFRK